MMPKVGGPAPDFNATTQEGNTLSLRSLRGRRVLLWFYPEADTPGWTVEGRGFRDHKDYFEENNIVVLGASLNAVEDNAEFARKNGFAFPLLCDADRSISIAYGACDSVKDRYAKRISFLIDKQGNVERIYDSVDPRDHAAQVLADVMGV